MDWKNYLWKIRLKKSEKTVKIKAKMSHVKKNHQREKEKVLVLTSKKVLAETPFSNSTLKLEPNKLLRFFAQLAKNHSLFRQEQLAFSHFSFYITLLHFFVLHKSSHQKKSSKKLWKNLLKRQIQRTIQVLWIVKKSIIIAGWKDEGGY